MTNDPGFDLDQEDDELALLRDLDESTITAVLDDTGDEHLNRRRHRR